MNVFGGYNPHVTVRTSHIVSWMTVWTGAHLDVDEVCNEGHEDHLLSIPNLLGVRFDLPLQFPPLSAVSHENLPEKERSKKN